MNKLPLVTIRVNAYNHEDYVEEALLSALQQTYNNCEVIVVDDGSSDNTYNIIQKLAEKYTFFHKTQQNKGLSATINDILRYHTKGKYIIGTASDDILMPDVVEKYVAYMEQNPELGMCYGNAYKINEKGEIFGKIIGSNKKGWLLEDIALGKCVVPLMTFMWRTDIFKKIGYYDSKIAAEDIYMLYKVAKHYPIGYVNTFARKYRHHKNNSSNNTWLMYQNSLKVISIYKNEPFFNIMKVKKEAKLFYLLSLEYKKEAMKYFFSALKTFHYIYFFAGILRLFNINIAPKDSK